MAGGKIKLACVRYDRTNAILDGRVKLDGFDLDVTEIHDVAQGFTRMYNGEFDVGEFSTTELIFFRSRAKDDFLGIPVFPWRMFRHGFVFYNAAAKISGPQDLKGKKVGFGEWIQTAAIWVRGILADEYGVPLKDVLPHSPAVHHWGDLEEKDEIKPKNGAVINWLVTDPQRRYELMDEYLLARKIDALVFPRAPESVLRGDPRVKRLFENYREEELGYFKKTRIFPIMHTVVVKRSVAEKYPDLPAKLFKFFCEAKKIGRQTMKRDRGTSIVWKDAYVADEEKVFGGDPWTYGFKKNEHVLEKLISYCYDQGVAERLIQPKDLMLPSALEFAEAD